MPATSDSIHTVTSLPATTRQAVATTTGQPAATRQAAATATGQSATVRHKVVAAPDTAAAVRPDSIAGADSLLRPVEAAPYSDALIRGDSALLRRPSLAETAQVLSPRNAGEALPFSFRNDDYVTGLLLLQLFLTVLIVARSRRYLGAAWQDFFSARHRENLFDEDADTEMSGRGFLFFQTAIAMGFLLFDWVQEAFPSVSASTSPYVLLGLNIGLCYLWALLRIFLYQQVNRILFPPEEVRAWLNGFLLLFIFQGLILLPVTLLVVYFDLSYTSQLLAVILTAVIGEILLLYKTYITFFSHKAGPVHIILYLCALEIIPFLLFWRLMVWANTWLTTLI